MDSITPNPIPFERRYHRIIGWLPLISIIVSNLWILVNVLIGRAYLYNIIILYWFETGVIGFFNLLKMACLDGNQAGIGAKIRFISFFCVHYFGFFLGQGVFITATMIDLYKQQATAHSNFLVMILVLILSHLLDFWLNYLLKGEFRTATLIRLMFRPYGRVFTQQVVILAGGFLLFHSRLSKHLVLVAVLVFMKIITEIGGYFWDRKFGKSNK